MAGRKRERYKIEPSISVPFMLELVGEWSGGGVWGGLCVPPCTENVDFSTKWRVIVHSIALFLGHTCVNQQVSIGSDEEV